MGAGDGASDLFVSLLGCVGGFCAQSFQSWGMVASLVKGGRDASRA